MDRFVETTRKGWFSRIGDSFGGALLGVLIFLVAFPVLFLNEGRAVRRAQDLEHGKDAVVSVRPEKADPANNGKLVHFSAEARAGEPVADPAFGVSVKALKLARQVEMYQWRETTRSSSKSKVGGSEETTKEYNYEKVWSDRHIDSSRFRKPAGHENPAQMPYESADFVAGKVKAGGFMLAPTFVDELSADTTYDATPTKLPAGGLRNGGGIYIGDPARAKVGDVRIRFSIATEGMVTVVGGQANGMIDVYKDADMSGEIALIERGKKSSDEMFKAAQEANYFLTWMLRVLGFILMFAGLRLAARPLAVVGSFIPFVGSIIGFGTGLVAFFVAFGLSAMTIAVAWLFYRPLLAIALFVAATLAITAAVVAVRRLQAA